MEVAHLVFMKGPSNIPFRASQEKNIMPMEDYLPFDCMFCNHTLTHAEELGQHVLLQHQAMLCEPGILQVEAQYLSPLDKGQVPAEPSQEKNCKEKEEFSCEVCGQTFTLALDIELHKKQHKDAFTYACSMCWRRFKKQWRLKNHMRTHQAKSGARKQPEQTLESPVTINDVVQVHTAGSFSSPYKMCLVCGFLFPNKESLIEHSRVHNKETTPAVTSKNLDVQQAGKESPKEEMVQHLNLHPKSQAETTSIPMTWIPQLDPITNYQAWQLPTTGQVKESSQEGITDNNFHSEKEELGEIWSEKKSESPGKIKTHKSSCPGFSEDGDKPRCLEGKVPSGAGDPNLPSSKKKPTRCSECSKAFRTYHQLVLHSRVHKKNRRSKAPSPLMSVDRRQPGTCLEELTTTVEERAALEQEVGSDDLHLDKNAVGGKEKQPSIMSVDRRQPETCFQELTTTVEERAALEQEVCPDGIHLDKNAVGGKEKQPSIMSVDRRQPETCFQELTTTVEERAALEQEVCPDGLHLDKNAVGGKEKQPSIMSVDRRQPETCFQELTTTVEERAALEQEVCPDGIHLDKNAVGGKENKPKSSRECSYCGKFFHSNSYLLIHLRTHTGKKPYNCDFCDYAAAQKSSLTKHLRHHKDQHPTGAISDVQREGKNQEMEDALLTYGVQTRKLKRISDGAKDVQGRPTATQPREMPSVFQSVLSGAGHSTTHREPQDFCKNATDFTEKLRKYPAPACLDILKMKSAAETQASSPAYKSEGDGSLEGGHRSSMERFDYYYKPSSGCQERPLTLPLGTLQKCPSVTLKTSLIPAMTCSFCTFKTFSQEVLIMHQRLHHKFTPDMLKSKSEMRSQQTRSPPALLGKDVPPSAGRKKLPAKDAFPTPTSLPPEKVPGKTPQFSGPDSSTLAPGNLKSNRPQPCTGGLRATTQQQPELLPKVSVSAAVDEVKRPEQKLETLTMASSQSPLSSSNGIRCPVKAEHLWAPQERDYFCHQNANGTTAKFKEPLPKRLKPSMLDLDTEHPGTNSRKDFDIPRYQEVINTSSLFLEGPFRPPIPPIMNSFLSPAQEQSPSLLTVQKTNSTSAPL